MTKTITRRGRYWLAALITVAGLLTGAALPASASSGPAPGSGSGHLHHGCAPHGLTTRHESLLEFDQTHDTYPAAVAGTTWKCYYGFLPPAVLAYLNNGDWSRALPPHVRLYFVFPIASPDGSTR